MSKEIARARKTMSDAFKKDNDFEYTYIANIAMLLYDRYNRCNFKDKDVRDKAAKEILSLIFN